MGSTSRSLAVSRVHTNTVVVASKDYRDGDNKHVWIETSTDGGATWPLSRQLQMPGLDPNAYPLQSDACGDGPGRWAHLCGRAWL